MLNSRNRLLSKKSEKQAAKEISGRTHIASGALKHQKGDFSNDDFIGEDKLTRAKSYSLKHDILQKIRREAYAKGKRPILRITLSAEDPKARATFVVLDHLTFCELIERMQP